MARIRTKRCETCAACGRLYRKKWFFFGRSKKLYCTALREMTEAENSCNEWKKREVICDLSSERFAEAEKDVAAISRKLSELGWE